MICIQPHVPLKVHSLWRKKATVNPDTSGIEERIHHEIRFLFNFCHCEWTSAKADTKNKAGVLSVNRFQQPSNQF